MAAHGRVHRDGTQATTSLPPKISDVATTSVSVIVYDSSTHSSPRATTSLTPASTPTNSEYSSHATSSTTNPSSAKSTGSASHKSSSNTSALIPAIVIPIAVVLLASFGLFWFFMRRRHRREMNNTNFIMAGKGEKLSSTTPSTRSNPSSMDGTSPRKAEPNVATAELFPDRTGMNSPPSYQADDIGVALALTPQDQHRPPRTDSAAGSISTQRRSPHVAQFSASGTAAPNFNSPRLGTAGQQRSRPPNPSVQNHEHHRNRSRSQPSNRGPPPPREGPGQYSNGDPGSSKDTYAQNFPDGAQGRSRAVGLPTSPNQGPRPFPRPIGAPRSFSPTGPVPAWTHRAAPPPPINAPPLGAYNGAGPISQFSPIVKETPGKKGPELRTNVFSDEHMIRQPESGSSSASGVGLGFSEENMRIARLGAGNSSGSHIQNVGPVTEKPRQQAHKLDLSRDKMEPDDDDFNDAKSGVSSLHEMERFDFDNWDGDGRSTRRVSRDDEKGRVSPIYRDSFSLDVR